MTKVRAVVEGIAFEAEGPEETVALGYRVWLKQVQDVQKERLLRELAENRAESARLFRRRQEIRTALAKLP